MWEPLDSLTNCKAAIIAFEQATAWSPPPQLPFAGAAGAPPLISAAITPTGYTVETVPPGDLGTALLGRTLLYLWPDDGWKRGTVERPFPRGAFSYVWAYIRQASALRVTADTLLDAVSFAVPRRHAMPPPPGPPQV